MALDLSTELKRSIAIFFFVCFREKDFLRISLCPYSTSTPHSSEPCCLTDQNFAKKKKKKIKKNKKNNKKIKIKRIEKGHPRNVSVKLVQNQNRCQSRFFKNFLMFPREMFTN